MKLRLKKILAILSVCAIATSSVAYASGGGVCTHMSQTFEGRNNPMDDVILAAKEVGAKWIRDELVWGFGMQTTKGGELKMPKEYWVDKVEEAGLNSLVILGYDNSVYDSNGGIPTTHDQEYLDAFTNYAKYVVSNTDGKIDAYEVWNEPNNGAFVGQIENPSAYDYTYSANDYVGLLKATYTAIKSVDSNAKVVGGSAIMWSVTANEWIAWVDELVKNGGQYMDVLSLHNYEYGSDGKNMRDVMINKITPILNKYNFKGEVWITESGDSVYTGTDGVSEVEQASRVISRMVYFEDWLKTNNRQGQYFHYELKNNQNYGEADKESNFGLFDYNFNIKPSGKAFKRYNLSTDDRSFVSLTEPKTYGNYKGKLATFSNGGSKTTYIAWDKNGRNDTRINLSLTGDFAKIYDYDGTLLDTVTGSNYTLSVDAEPKFVVCDTYETEITSSMYDLASNQLTVTGKYYGGDSVTLELLKDNTVEKSITAEVTENSFSKTFSVVGLEGVYTLRVGQPEISAKGKQSGWAQRTVDIEQMGAISNAFVGVPTVNYNKSSNTVSVSGKLTDYYADETMLVLAVPEGTLLGNIDKEQVAYFGTVNISSNATFATEFKLPADAAGKYNVFLRSSYSTLASDDVSLDENQYIMVGNFTASRNENVITATVTAKNLASINKHAIVLIAQYDTDGRRLLGVNSTPIDISAHTSVSESIDCTADKLPDATAWKAFLWTDMNSFIPLADSVSGN